MNVYYKLDTGDIVALRNDTVELGFMTLGIDYKIKNFPGFDFKNYKVDLSTLELVEIPVEVLAENKGE